MIRYRHPYQNDMKLPEPEEFFCEYDAGRMASADAIVCHFVGWPRAWPEPPSKPMAFRNANIRYRGDVDMFWCEPQYTADDMYRYAICASSHVGAKAFFEDKDFRWLPDLIDIWAPELVPDYSGRYPCLSYIKHAEALDFCELGIAIKQNCLMRPHDEIVDRRRRLATVVVDNLCDGHWGLSGHEAIALGLPTLVYNNTKTIAALRDYVGAKDGWNDRLDHPSLPFGELVGWVPMRKVGRVDDMRELIGAVEAIHAMPSNMYDALRHDIRGWAERHFDSRKLIERFWTPFFDELLIAKPWNAQKIEAVRA